MLKIAFIIAVFISKALQYDQNGFVLIFERAEMVRSNPNYVQDCKISTFKYNRTQGAQNISLTIKEDFGNALKIEVQAYKMASNEYRLFPLRFSFNLCQTIARNDFGLNQLYHCGNFTRCPMKKGKYLICNFIVDHKKFPPFIPEGSYMLDIKYWAYNTEMFFNRGYGTIKNLNKWDLH